MITTLVENHFKWFQLYSLYENLVTQRLGHDEFQNLLDDTATKFIKTQFQKIMLNPLENL